MRHLIVVLLVSVLCGCAGFLGLDTRKGASSSAVAYLYPDGGVPDLQTEVLPVVGLPARVGLAFTPTPGSPAGFTAADRQELLEQVRDAFARQPYVGRIEVIPESYLRPAGGFADLERAARLFGVDLVVLVSFDQLVTTNESAGSLLYWTLVGAYVVKASRNEVITFVDAAVLHLPSRSLLFRAAGEERLGQRSTAIQAERRQQELARLGFEGAMADMTGNLESELRRFDQRVRHEGQVRLVDRRSGRDWHAGEGGQGALGLPGLLIVLVLSCCILARPRT